jgi:hypothetical protein
MWLLVEMASDAPAIGNVLTKEIIKVQGSEPKTLDTKS